MSLSSSLLEDGDNVQTPESSTLLFMTLLTFLSCVRKRSGDGGGDDTQNYSSACSHMSKKKGTSSPEAECVSVVFFCGIVCEISNKMNLLSFLNLMGFHTSQTKEKHQLVFTKLAKLMTL